MPKTHEHCVCLA